MSNMVFFSPLSLQIREDAAHNISVGGTDAAPLLSLGASESGEGRCGPVWTLHSLCITTKDMVWVGRAGERGLA